jgi:hypothetical protein
MSGGGAFQQLAQGERQVVFVLGAVCAAGNGALDVLVKSVNGALTRVWWIHGTASHPYPRGWSGFGRRTQTWPGACGL